MSDTPEPNRLNNPDMTLREAWEYMEPRMQKKGTKCLLCFRNNQVYHRHLHEGNVKFLAMVLAKWDRDWFHVGDTNHFKNGPDYSKLQYWGLIEKAANDSPAKTSSGIWRVTAAGRQFVNGELALAETLHVLNDVVIGASETLVKIEDVMGKAFDIREVLNDWVAPEVNNEAA